MTGEQRAPVQRQGLRPRIEQMVANQQSWIDAGRSGQAISRDAMRDALQLALDETLAHDAEVRALPDREEAIEGLRVAMLGTTDGDFIHPESPIPAGEMFRLASEYLEALFGQEGQR